MCDNDDLSQLIHFYYKKIYIINKLQYIFYFIHLFIELFLNIFKCSYNIFSRLNYTL